MGTPSAEKMQTFAHSVCTFLHRSASSCQRENRWDFPGNRLFTTGPTVCILLHTVGKKEPMEKHNPSGGEATVC